MIQANQSFIGSCLSCKKCCQQPNNTNFNEHHGFHIKHKTPELIEEIHQFERYLQPTIITKIIKQHYQLFLSELQKMIKRQLSTIESYYTEHICRANKISPKTINQIKKGNFNQISCADVGMLQVMMSNMISSSKLEEDTEFIKRVIEEDNNKMAVLQNRLKDKLIKNIKKKMSDPVIVKESYIPGPNIKKEKQNIANDKSKQPKNKYANTQQPINEIRPRNHNQLINIIDAHEKMEKFTIEVDIMQVNPISKGRVRAVIKDQSGKAVLIIRKDDKITKRNRVNITKCKFLVHKGEKQIQAQSDAQITLIIQRKPQDIKKTNKAEKQTKLYPPNLTQNPISSSASLLSTNFEHPKKIQAPPPEKLQQNKPRRIPNKPWIKIQQILPGETNYRIIAKIIRIINVGDDGEKILCIVGDETGIVKAQLPGKFYFIQEEETLEMSGVEASVIDEHIILTTVKQQYENQDGIVRKSLIRRSREKIRQILLQNNISEKSWVAE